MDNLSLIPSANRVRVIVPYADHKAYIEARTSVIDKITGLCQTIFEKKDQMNDGIYVDINNKILELYNDQLFKYDVDCAEKKRTIVNRKAPITRAEKLKECEASTTQKKKKNGELMFDESGRPVMTKPKYIRCKYCYEPVRNTKQCIIDHENTQACQNKKHLIRASTDTGVVVKKKINPLKHPEFLSQDRFHSKWLKNTHYIYEQVFTPYGNYVYQKQLCQTKQQYAALRLQTNIRKKLAKINVAKKRNEVNNTNEILNNL